MTAEHILSFAEFRLDPVSGHLYRRNDRVPLAPKSFALLQFLAGQA
jgi:DNA-binding winged helix-turn-helix (wHTH) protein